MGHLDNQERVIEARLTALGRKRLAEGDGLNVSQFALADDEVDYGLWQDSLPEEDAGAIIENLPTFEAFTDETQSMRYKLISLESDSSQIPQIDVSSDLQTINVDDTDQINTSPVNIDLSTNLEGKETQLDQTLGYTAILQDRTIADIEVAPNGGVEEDSATIPALFGEKEGIGSSQVSSVVGTEFRIGWSGSSLDIDAQTTLTIIGNETGLSVDITINVLA